MDKALIRVVLLLGGLCLLGIGNPSSTQAATCEAQLVANFYLTANWTRHIRSFLLLFPDYGTKGRTP